MSSIKDNLIQGNKGGNIGGGITLFHYNGLDVRLIRTTIRPIRRETHGTGPRSTTT